MSGEMRGLPEGWVEAGILECLDRLSDGKQIHQGWSPQCESYPSDSIDNWAAIKTTAIQDGRFESEHNKQLPVSLQPRERLEITAGDLLMTCAGPRSRCGVVCLVRHTRPKLFISGKMYRFRADQYLTEPRWIEGFLRSSEAQEKIDSMKTGISESGMNLTHDRFATLQIPLAPLAEQKVIADKLDALLAQADTLKARLDAIPAILKRFRQSVLSAAVTGKLTQEWRTQIDESPSWTPKLLGEIAFVTKLAGFEYTEFVRYVPNGDLKVLKAENAGREGFKETEYSTVNSGDVSALTRSRVVAGDLIMAFVGAGTGQIGLVPDGDNWFLGPNIALIRVDTTMASSKFVELFCKSLSGWGEIQRFMKSTAQPSLSMKTIRQFSINLPSITEQTEIIRRVESLFAFADQIEARAQEATARVKHLTQSILAKAFRGELTDEWRKAHPELVSGQNSAEALLERIRAERAAAPEAKSKRGRKASSESDASLAMAAETEMVKKRGRPRKG